MQRYWTHTISFNSLQTKPKFVKATVDYIELNQGLGMLLNYNLWRARGSISTPHKTIVKYPPPHLFPGSCLKNLFFQMIDFGEVIKGFGLVNDRATMDSEPGDIQKWWEVHVGLGWKK